LISPAVESGRPATRCYRRRPYDRAMPCSTVRFTISPSSMLRHSVSADDRHSLLLSPRVSMLSVLGSPHRHPSRRMYVQLVRLVGRDAGRKCAHPVFLSSYGAKGNFDGMGSFCL